jgi:Family of unknown function (DUF6510)
MEPLDGNAAAGALSEVFALELTAARGCCRSCGNVAFMAEALAFVDAPGVVLRCRACEQELVVLVRADNRYVVSLSGVAWLELRAH